MKILQVLGGLDFGGTETLLVKLSLGLKQRGHEVIVASGGGPLAAELEAAGIPCPLVKTRGSFTFLKARRELVELIESERPQLIHAHHWSAGAAAFLAARQIGLPYLLSVHGTRPALQRLSTFYWSEKILVFSEGVAKNLVEKQRIPPDRIVTSFVGVDIDRFKPAPPPTHLMGDLGLAADMPVVLHVSRFSRAKSRVGIELAAAAPSLAEFYPGLRVLLVGWGEYGEQVRLAVEQANAAIGRQVVYALGARGDVPDLMRAATMVVGTASVVLEAMASGCPVVAAGKYGYWGPVTPESFTVAYGGHFGDTTAPGETRAEILARDLQQLLGGVDLRRSLGEWGRRQAVESFSVERMVAQVESVYEDTIAAKPKSSGIPQSEVL